MEAAHLVGRALSAEWLGRIGYEDALLLQKAAEERVAAGGPETFFLLEHEAIFTLGRNAKASDILFTSERCRALGIDVRETDRGGKVTYHGPGQLVGYPVLSLGPGRRDVKRYVTDLEEVLIRTLADFGIPAARSPLPERVTSVWVGNDKIAAIGVHVSRWITTHGFALNVTSETLANFAGIVPCGITDGGVTSMERILQRKIPVTSLLFPLRKHFGDVFEREIIAG